jgi:hypothetical protein
VKTRKIIGDIECLKKKGCLRNLKKDVQPGCMDCPEAKTTIIDLEGKPVFVYRSPKEKTGIRKRKK